MTIDRTRQEVFKFDDLALREGPCWDMAVSMPLPSEPSVELLAERRQDVLDYLAWATPELLENLTPDELRDHINFAAGRLIEISLLWRAARDAEDERSAAGRNFEEWAEQLNAEAIRRGEVCNQPDHLPNIFWEAGFPLPADRIAKDFRRAFCKGLTPAAALDESGYETWDVIARRNRAAHPWWRVELMWLRLKMFYRARRLRPRIITRD